MSVLKIAGLLMAGAVISAYAMFCAAPLPEPPPLNVDLPAAMPPKEMAVYKILTGVNHRSAAFAYRGGSYFNKRDFCMMALLVKHPKGDLLIDAGFGRDCKTHFKTMPFYFQVITDFDPGKAAADQLTASGYDISSLRGILLTHAHWDHTSGVADFPETPVWINKEEHQFIDDGNSLTALIRSFPKIQYKEYAFKDIPYLNFPKSYDVYGDGSIVIVPAPGHTPGSVIIFISLPSGERYAMIGDLAWQREGVLLREERPWPQRILGDNNSKQVRENLLRMAAIAKRFPKITIVPAHDPRAFESIPFLNTSKSTP